MTGRTFCQCGTAETVKGGFHAAALGLVACMAAYNIVAWYYRSESHLARNAIIYTGAALYEVPQVKRHWSRRG